MKNLMKRGTALLLILLLMLGAMAGCAGNKENKTDDAEQKEQDGLIVQRTISPTIEGAAPTAAPTQNTDPQPTVTPEATEPSKSPEQTTENQTQTAAPAGTVAISYVTAADVNVRTSPDPAGEVLTKLAQNTIVYVTNKDAGNDWCEIYYEGAKAYMASYYLNTISEGATLNTAGKATVNADEINLRADDTTDSEILGQAAKDDQLDVLKKDAGGEWSMVLYEGKVAFIATRYLNF